MMTMLKNRSRSSQGHDLYIHNVTGVIDASCHASLKNQSTSSGEDFLKGFYHIWAWWPSWSCDLDYLYIYWFPIPIDASYKIRLSLAKLFQRRRSLNIIVIIMYFAPGWGQTNPWGPFFFRITYLQSICPFPASFSFQMTF